MRNVCWCIMYMPYRYIGHPYSLPSCSFSTSSPLPSSSSSSTSSSSWSSISLHQPDCTKPSEPQVWTLVCQVLKIKPNSISLDCNFKISIKLELQGALGIPTSSLLDIAFVPSALRMSDPCKAKMKAKMKSVVRVSQLASEAPGPCLAQKPKGFLSSSRIVY